METSIKTVLKTILDLAKIPYSKITIQEKKDEEGIPVFLVDIESKESSLLIGYHGETIYSLQHLLKTILRHQSSAEEKDEEMKFKVYLDIDNYRQRQEESVINLAVRKAELVKNIKQPQILPPMSAYFRRLIHLHFRDPKWSDLETESIGENERRQIVIKLKQREEE